MSSHGRGRVLHDGHRHAEHDGHWDECEVAVAPGSPTERAVGTA